MDGNAPSDPVDNIESLVDNIRQDITRIQAEMNELIEKKELANSEPEKRDIQDKIDELKSDLDMLQDERALYESMEKEIKNQLE